MNAVEEQVLGCSKCRYSVRGCKRCRDPAFRQRQSFAGPKRPVKKLKRAQKQPASFEIECLPADVSQTEHKPSTSSSAPARPETAQRGPSSTCQPRTSPFFEGGQPAATGSQPQQQSAQQPGHRTSPYFETSPACSPAAPGSGRQHSKTGLTASESHREAGQDAARKDSEPARTRDRCRHERGQIGHTANCLTMSSDHHHTDLGKEGTHVCAAASSIPVQPGSFNAQQPATSDGDAAVPFLTISNPDLQPSQPASSEARLVPEADAAAVSDSDTDTRRQAFASMLQDTILKRKQQRQEPATSPAQQRLLGKHAKPRAKRVTGGLKAVGDPRIATWEPPPSPFGLIEEVLYHDPWKLLMACMLLNKTSGRAVRKILWELLRLIPDAEAARHVDVTKVQELIYPLGLSTKRAVMLKRFSEDYLDKQWTDPLELHGIGQYAADAYFMFCRGCWREVHPADKDLLKYSNWLHETDGLGAGLERDPVPDYIHPGV